MEKNRFYAAIDLKSFYASVECIERGLAPLGTHLVVADASRKSYEKSYEIRNGCWLHEVRTATANV